MAKVRPPGVGVTVEEGAPRGGSAVANGAGESTFAAGVDWRFGGGRAAARVRGPSAIKGGDEGASGGVARGDGGAGVARKVEGPAGHDNGGGSEARGGERRRERGRVGEEK